MMIHRFAGLLFLPLVVSAAIAQGPAALPVLDDKPTPQIDAGGPSAAVTCLAFSADGETLYAAGLDKVVRVWVMKDGRFTLRSAFRVPVGPGNAGGVNAVALSPDGAWVAVAGRAPIRGEAGFRVGGVIVESAALAPDQMLDAGVIYVANTANPAGGKVLRGHRGEVRALAFAPAAEGKPPLLVSAATERDGARRFGGLRLWNAASGKSLAEQTDLPARGTRPGLAVWHSGPGVSQVRVAVTWPEDNPSDPSYLRLWDAGPDAKPLQGWGDDRYTQPAALIGQSGGAARVLTGGLGQRAGRLCVWSLGAERNANAAIAAEVMFPPGGEVPFFLPVSLGVVPARDDAPLAAVVLRPDDKAPAHASDFRLALVDLAARKVVADVPLAGSDKTQLPAVAAHRRYVAVASARDHAVRVFATDDLLAGKAEPRAVLGGGGLAPRQIAFADQGRGLWLSEDETAQFPSGGLLFDFARRQVRANDRPDLRGDAPDLERGGWSVAIDDDRKGVRVRQGGRDLPAVRFGGRDELVTAAALRPAAKDTPAILAVAYTERDAGRYLIRLFDPASGKPFRQMTTHLQQIRALAFSATRPLLASVADDQTVCVWGLSDLDRAVGQVSGLGVSDEGGNVVVRRVDPDGPAGLAEGDVLEKLGSGDAAKPIKSAAEFTLAVSGRKPGDRIEVAVRGKGAVRLPVGRGVDERKPLFSLFLLRGDGPPDWIGWSPAGPYDFSGPRAESHLGWHTNTGDPAAPVSYVEARTHRNRYHREGILGHLAAEADLPRALEKWRQEHPDSPAQPALRVRPPDGALPTELPEQFLVRKAVAALSVGINDDFDLDAESVLRFQVTRTDGGNVKGGAAELSGQAAREGRDWRADLSGVDWRRGEYRVRLGLFARDGGPDLVWKAVTFRLQPPAPTIRLRRDGQAVTATERQPLAVMTDALTLQVGVEVAPAQEVDVRFAQWRNGEPRNDAPPARSAAAGEFAQEFKLHEGLNRISIRAVNKGALAGHEGDEAAAAEFWVGYKAPRELPPSFAELRLDPRPEDKRTGADNVWIVNRPAVTIGGRIEGAGVLVKAGWSAGGGDHSLLPEMPASAADFKFTLDGLKADQPVTVRLWAQSKLSDPNTTERTIVFHPPLPAISADPTAGPDVFADKVTLTGVVQAATADPFDLSFRVTSASGPVRTFKPEPNARAGEWKVELTLLPGGNTVEAFVANKWRGERAAGSALTLNYRRPPRITAIPEQVEAAGTNKVRLALTVEGPAGRPPRAVRVDGKPVEFKAGQPRTQGEHAAWPVELPEVFVGDGGRDRAELSVRAVTDEGESPPATVRVLRTREPQLPSVRFLSPASDTTARRPEVAVVFRVESARPLERVKITGGKEPYALDLRGVAPEGQTYAFQGEARVSLSDGPNTLELVAFNADGRSPAAKLVVSYVESAVLIRVDGVELRSEADEVERVLTPSYGPKGELTLPPADRSLVWLVGRVRWSDPKAAALDDPGLKVSVTVRDCRQLPVALGPRGSGDEAGVRRFRVPMVLIGEENRVRIDVPTVGQQELSRREFEIACASPARNQRLHLLIVGVNVEDAGALKDRVLDALSADAKGRPERLQGEFVKNPPFERCFLYHVLAGEVERGQVEAQMEAINREIVRLRREKGGWLNDVVLIYYQGEDVVVPGTRERWLKTSKNVQYARVQTQKFAVPCHALPRIPGAQFMLLNVSGATDARLAGPDWGGDPDTGFMRYACLDPAEMRAPDPPLLGMLHDATQHQSRLGEVVQHVNQIFERRPSLFKPLVVLDQDQQRRTISQPAR